MGQQHATTQSIHSAVIERVIAEVELWIHHRALPLPDIPLAVRLKRLGQRLEQFGGCALVAPSARNGDREFTVAREIDFARERNVAVLGAAELPVHFEIVYQVLPTIAGANVADRAASESRA